MLKVTKDQIHTNQYLVMTNLCFQLFGLLGFESFDLIAEILANRRVIREPSGFDFLDEESNFDIYSGGLENVPKIPHFKQERGPAISTQVCGE